MVLYTGCYGRHGEENRIVNLDNRMTVNFKLRERKRKGENKFIDIFLQYLALLKSRKEGEDSAA